MNLQTALKEVERCIVPTSDVNVVLPKLYTIYKDYLYQRAVSEKAKSHNVLWDDDDWKQVFLIGLWEGLTLYIKSLTAEEQVSLYHCINKRLLFQTRKSYQLIRSKKSLSASQALRLEDSIYVSSEMHTIDNTLFQLCIEEFVEKLDARSKKILTMKLQGYTIKEICKECKLSDGTIYNSLHTILSKLKEEGII